jgi:hypothetical protein
MGMLQAERPRAAGVAAAGRRMWWKAPAREGKRERLMVWGAHWSFFFRKVISTYIYVYIYIYMYILSLSLSLSLSL